MPGAIPDSNFTIIPEEFQEESLNVLRHKSLKSRIPGGMVDETLGRFPEGIPDEILELLD